MTDRFTAVDEMQRGDLEAFMVDLLGLWRQPRQRIDPEVSALRMVG